MVNPWVVWGEVLEVYHIWVGESQPPFSLDFKYLLKFSRSRHPHPLPWRAGKRPCTSRGKMFLFPVFSDILSRKTMKLELQPEQAH